jgi:Lon protease-like protein
MVLPLHIFEPRYREMLADALAADGIIGMVLLRGDWQRHYYGRPEIFPTGTAGRVVRHEALVDGCSDILLAGIREFGVEEEYLDRSYRQACVRWREEGGAALSVDERRKLTALSQAYLERGAGPAWAAVVAAAHAADDLFVNAFCQAMDVPPVEKLWLLEASSMSERCGRLCDLLEFGIEEGKLPAGGGTSRTH